MAKEETIIRFEDVSFKYNNDKVILDEVNFNVRRNSKITIMGQNGAGKSTIFKLLMGELQPQKGQIHIEVGAKIGIAQQMVPRDKLTLSLLEYFRGAFPGEAGKLEKEVYRVLQSVNLNIDPTKKVSELSGGQKARLLLAYALIQDPDILLLPNRPSSLSPRPPSCRPLRP